MLMHDYHTKFDEEWIIYFKYLNGELLLMRKTTLSQETQEAS